MSDNSESTDEPNSGNSKASKSGKSSKAELNAAILESIKEIQDDSRLFTGTNTNVQYITWVDDQGVVATDVIQSELFRDKLQMVLCQEVSDDFYPKSLIDKIIIRLKAVANRSNNKKEIFSRVAKTGDMVVYNLNNQGQEYIVITPNEVSIATVEDIYDEDFAFAVNEHMAPQVMPVATEKNDLFERIIKYINLEYNDQVLLVITIITWLIPNVPKAIILLNGEAGTGKTVLSSIIQEIVDPTSHNVLAIPDDKESMGVALGCHYLLTVDNISELSKGTSDLLCQASTGGSIISRTKFTNYGASIISFKNCVILNGITVENAKPDLMDRTIKLEMKELTSNYDSVEEIINNFKDELPEIMYLIFQVLKQALAIHKDLDKKMKSRMFDYMQWGRAISMAMFGSDEIFINAYMSNKGTVVEDVIANDPFACTLKQYLDGHLKYPFNVIPSILYEDLSKLATDNNVNINGIGWPQSPQAMSNLIKRLQPAFRSVGYEFNISSKNKTNGNRYIRIGKK